MDARLKLNGIDGMAPPGVDLAAYLDSALANLAGPDIVRIERLIPIFSWVVEHSRSSTSGQPQQHKIISPGMIRILDTHVTCSRVTPPAVVQLRPCLDSHWFLDPMCALDNPIILSMCVYKCNSLTTCCICCITALHNDMLYSRMSSVCNRDNTSCEP